MGATCKRTLPEEAAEDCSSQFAKVQRPLATQGLRAALHFSEGEVTFELAQGLASMEASSTDPPSPAAFKQALEEHEACRQLGVAFNCDEVSATAVIKLKKDKAFQLPLIADLAQATEGNNVTNFHPPCTVWAFTVCMLILEGEGRTVCEHFLANEALHASLAGQCLQVAEFLQADELLKNITTWLPSCFRSYALTSHKSQHCCCQDTPDLDNFYARDVYARETEELEIYHRTGVFYDMEDDMEDDTEDDPLMSHVAFTMPDEYTNELQWKMSHLAKVVSNLPERFLAPLLKKVAFANASCSHSIALTKWLQACPATLHIGKELLVGAPCGRDGCTGPPLVSSQQWLRVLQCMKDAPQITELHVWGGMMLPKAAWQWEDIDIAYSMHSCNTFFVALASYPQIEHSPRLELEKLVIDNMELAPNAAIIKTALCKLSQLACISHLQLNEPSFTVPENPFRHQYNYTPSDAEQCVDGARELLKALGRLNLKNLTLPKSLWLELIGDGGGESDCVGQGAKEWSTIFSDESGSLLGLSVNGKIACVQYPKAKSRMESSCPHCDHYF